MKLDVQGFDQVHRLELGAATAFVAIHRAPYGRSFGGIRVRRYPNDEAALRDARLLAVAMSRKVVLAGLPAGGAKTVVRAPAGDWPDEERRRTMHELGRFIASLDGRYHCGADLGLTLSDHAALAAETDHIAPLDLGAWTARSVIDAMYAVSSPDVVAVQGLGAVGGVVAELLRDAGVRVIGTDVSADALAAVDGIETVEHDEIWDVACDVFSPCAGGGVLDLDTVERLQCSVVCGGANNPFASVGDVDDLHARGILYVPDVLSNAGAVIKGASDAMGQSDQIEDRMALIPRRVNDVIARAKAESQSPHRVAREMADGLLVLSLER